MALLILIFLAACGQTDLKRIDTAAQTVGAVRADDVWPELPADCRLTSRSGIQRGDRLDVAVLKADAALSRQNARTLRCARWYQQIRAQFIAEALQ